MKTGHREKAIEFFKVFANKLHAEVASKENEVSDSWCRWFILPYIQNPENDPYFHVFFTKEWLEAFVVSLRNFLTLIFRNLPLPKILAFQLSRFEEPSLKLRLKVSQSECIRLRLYNIEANEKIQRLEQAGRQLHSVLKVMVQNAYSENFNSSTSSNKTAKVSGISNTSAPTSNCNMLSKDQLKQLNDLFGTPSNSPPEKAPPSSEVACTTKMIMTLDPMMPIEGFTDTEGGAKDEHKEEKNETKTVPIPPSSSTLLAIPSSPAESIINTTDASLDSSSSIGDVDRSFLEAEKSRSSKRSSATFSNRSDAPDDVNGTSSKKAVLVKHMNHPSGVEMTTKSSITLCCFSPDGQYIATTGREERQIKIWSTNAVVITPTYVIHVPISVTSFDWYASESPQQLLLYGLADGMITLWNVDEKVETSTTKCHENSFPKLIVCAKGSTIGARALQYPESLTISSPTGSSADVICDNSINTVMASSSSRVLLELWDISSLKIKQQYSSSSPKNEVTSIAWNSRGDSFFIVSGWKNGEIKIFDPKKAEPVYYWKAYSSSSVNSVTFTPMGESILSLCTSGKEILEWSLVLNKAPKILRQYEIVVPLASTTSTGGSINSSHSSCSNNLLLDHLERKIRFDPRGQYFILPNPNGTSLSKAVSLYKTGFSNPIVDFVFLNPIVESSSCSSSSSSSSSAAASAGAAAFDVVTCIDWHPVLPMICIASQDTSIKLWNVKELLNE
jgi:WD40 repeat protein